jgi:hypothetical protein
MFRSLLLTFIFTQGITKLPLIVKGVQSLEDVQLCVEHGVEGVIIVSLPQFSSFTLLGIL